MTLITGYEIPLVFAIGFLLARYLFKQYLPSYFSEKGKNLATREDIEEITSKVEAIRSQYLLIVEELKARHQLRLAAVDRRLEVHQQAFVLWRKVLAAMNTEDVGKVVIECQNWWEQNCIYLEPKVREAFVVAYSSANMHRSLVINLAEESELESNRKLIIDFPDALFEAVQLPTLSEIEGNVLRLNDA